MHSLCSEQFTNNGQTYYNRWHVGYNIRKIIRKFSCEGITLLAGYLFVSNVYLKKKNTKKIIKF